MKIDNVYGGMLFRGSIPQFKEHRKDLLEAVYELHEKEKGKSHSNQGGWQSNYRLFENEHPEFRWLIQMIRGIGGQCIKKAEGAYLKEGLVLGATWVNINPSGAWNAPHNHIPCEWVGVAYLKTNENPVKRGSDDELAEGDIMFLDTQTLGPQYRVHRPLFRHFSPKNGDILVFPGYLVHMVAPHMDKEDRISVAFNFRLEQHMKISSMR